MARGGYVYILASQPNGTLYIGVTSNLEQRMQQHRAELIAGFTRKYAVNRLVYFEGFYFEGFDRIEDAIGRERQLKKWNRDWKKNLIERENPHWADLAAAWFEAADGSCDG